MKKFLKVLKDIIMIVLCAPFLAIYFVGVFLLLIAAVGIGAIGYIFDR